MRRNLSITFFLFALFACSLIHTASANTIGDSSTIALQVKVSETEAGQSCGFEYGSTALNLSHQNSSDCRYNSQELLIKARELSSIAITSFDSIQIVTLTVTAP